MAFTLREERIIGSWNSCRNLFILSALGCKTSGSDRALNSPENRRIVDSLRAKGVRLYPQDGSRYADPPAPAALVYSTAIEGDNPDFLRAPDGAARLHRSEAMRLLVEKLAASVFAVTGSCGKTTVSAWLAETLDRLGAAPALISGGLVKHFIRDEFAGNYAPGNGKLCVLEADESDKSLLNYTADHAMILNIGTDHYSKEELTEVFRKFLRRTRISAVIEDRVLDAVGTDCVRHLEVALFSTAPDAPAEMHGYKVFRVTDYRSGDGKVTAKIDGREVHLPAPGLHNAANAAAVFAGLSLSNVSQESGGDSISPEEHGAARRFTTITRTTLKKSARASKPHTRSAPAARCSFSSRMVTVRSGSCVRNCFPRSKKC